MFFPVWQLEGMAKHGWMANSHDPEGGLHEVGIGLAFGAEELCSQIIVLFASLEIIIKFRIYCLWPVLSEGDTGQSFLSAIKIFLTI